MIGTEGTGPGETPADASDEDALIAELKERFERSARLNSDNHKLAMDDLRFLAGEHWTEKAKREREIDGRPCLTINKLPTFLHQVTNDQRQNVPAIKISAVDSDSDPDTAEVVQGMVRHIEYASGADAAYDTAVNSAAAIGFGYFRLITDYCYPDSFDQDIKFCRIRNPFTVYMSEFLQADGSDMDYCILSSRLPRTEFTRRWPEAKAADMSGFSKQIGDKSSTDWSDSDSVRVAEYYRCEYEKQTLVLMPDGSTEWADVLDKHKVDYAGAKTRESARKKVMLYTMTGVDVLERTEIKCDWIPVFQVFGDELDIDGKVTRSGMIRHAKDPSRMYSFWMTAATEEVAMRPRAPFIGAVGQFETAAKDWDQANNRSLPFLEYDAVTVDGQMAPPPQRQPMADIPSGMLAMAMHANDNIKATTGLFDSSLGARGNATSGVQERSQQRQGNLSNFHYTDNLNRAVRHAGRCLVSMIPHYYDATRVVRIMGADGKIESAEINKPVPPEQIAQQQQAQQAQQQQAQPDDPAQERAQAIKTVLNDLSVGQYDVTVRAGPSYDTLRQEALESMVDVAGKWPKLMDIAGDKVIRAMDWPGAEEIADRVEKTIPPEIRGDEGQQAPVVNTPHGPVPLDQAAQMLAQMDQQIQAMGQALQAAQGGLEKAKIDAQSRENVAEINAVSKQDAEELRGMVALLVAKANAPPELPAAAMESAAHPDPSVPPPQDRADQTHALLAQMVQMMAQPRDPVQVIVERGGAAKRRMAIQGPSGAVYNGQIDDVQDDPQ